MISNAKGGHVSPGIYTEEKEVTYSVKSLGITTLGLAGETLKGPAFQPISIESWSDFVDYFGGTSSEKYTGTLLPKYELPYIAKSYLKKSKKLQVVRALGLSGYEAGKAFVIGAKVTPSGATDASASTTYPLVILRSKGKYGENTETGCEKGNSEKIGFYVDRIDVSAYSGSTYTTNCTEATGTTETYSLSGTVNLDGNNNGVKVINGFNDKFCIVAHINQKNETGETVETTAKYNVSLNPYDKDYIYNVFTTDPKTGNAELFVEAIYDYAFNKLVQDTEIGSTIEIVASTNEDCKNYKETFRCAVTPWIVSEVKSASSEKTEMKKLFKFYTISDGNASNFQVKISIQNINPVEGTFDVLVRDFYDTDISPVVLEKYTKCSLKEGSSSFIGLKIGTYDGTYELKSKYVTVRFNDNEEISDCVPAGFLGYPIPTYGMTNRIKLEYSDVLDSNLKVKKQYFGLNNEILDEDILTYKGVCAYEGDSDANPDKLTNGFHLDAILSDEVRNSSGSNLSSSTIYVDGKSGFTFSTVSAIQEDSYENIPRIIDGSYMDKTIYSDIATRKFTVYPYGGFDGWDIYRNTRTNTDEYRCNKYTVTSGCPFENVGSGETKLDPMLNLNLPSKANSSDYYAYLGAYNQFMNPEDVDINILATPGIDWKNNTLLVEDVISMIEDSEDGRGGDAIYIVTTPQYNGDNNMYTPKEIAEELENTGIQSSYAATYFPWVKYYDAEDKRYIDLPVTKDVVRNMAQTDNESYPWFAPAGMQRGDVDCVKAVLKTKLTDEDTLYNGLINPVKTFSADGVKVWGNKTMYDVETPTNRINVRRLMLRLKKLIKSAAKDLIFDQYDDVLEKQFRSIIDPILLDVKSNRGLYDYRIKTEVTEETKDQHILPAEILVKPTPTLEYISLTFTIYPESVQFDE